MSADFRSASRSSSCRAQICFRLHYLATYRNDKLALSLGAAQIIFVKLGGYLCLTFQKSVASLFRKLEKLSRRYWLRPFHRDVLPQIVYQQGTEVAQAALR